MEYLFWVWDPGLTDHQNELMWTLEEGFMSANAYFVINFVMFYHTLIYLFFTATGTDFYELEHKYDFAK